MVLIFKNYIIITLGAKQEGRYFWMLAHIRSTTFWPPNMVYEEKLNKSEQEATLFQKLKSCFQFPLSLLTSTLAHCTFCCLITVLFLNLHHKWKVIECHMSTFIYYTNNLTKPCFDDICVLKITITSNWQFNLYLSHAVVIKGCYNGLANFQSRPWIMPSLFSELINGFP